MKKLLASIFMVLLLMVSPVFGAIDVTEEPVAEATNGFDFGVSGDVFFPLTGDRQYKLIEGVSLKVATLYEGMLSVNVIMADIISGRDSLYGAGVTVNIPKLFEKAKGNWIADAINPSVGLAGLLDLNPVDSTGIKVIPAVHISIIRYEF